MEAADARQFFDFATQAPKLPSSLAIAGTLGVLLVIVFVFESMQISATNDSPKTHAELTEVEESVIQGAYQILAGLDIPVLSSLFLHVVLCYWGQYRLGRQLKLSVTGASIAALICTQCGFLCTHLAVGHVTLVLAYARAVVMVQRHSDL